MGLDKNTREIRDAFVVPLRIARLQKEYKDAFDYCIEVLQKVPFDRAEFEAAIVYRSNVEATAFRQGALTKELVEHSRAYDLALIAAMKASRARRRFRAFVIGFALLAGTILTAWSWYQIYLRWS